MRSSYDTLASKTKGILKKYPFPGHLFVFVNRGRTSCKCLYYDGTGFVTIVKRLNRGRFSKFKGMCESVLYLLTDPQHSSGQSTYTQ